MTEEERKDFIAGLRELADWLEATPSAPVPVYHAIAGTLADKEDAQQLARDAGSIKKEYTDYGQLILTKQFGDIVRYRAAIARDKVCTVKETRRVEKEVPVYVPPVYAKQMVDEVEWECDPLLAPSE